MPKVPIAGRVVLNIVMSDGMSNKVFTIWTIGHSTRTAAEFLALLAANGIETVADVRRYAGSRKYPQFNPEPLCESLAQVGVEYVALPELGGRRRARMNSRNTVWRNEAFRGYADYMETPEFQTGIMRLLELAQRNHTAIMCAEAVWWRCHRRIIADYLLARGKQVFHILGKGHVEPATMTPSAKAQPDGVVLYPAAEA